MDPVRGEEAIGLAGKRRPTRTFLGLLLLVGYFLLWILPRLPAITQNVLLMDDFNLRAVTHEHASEICRPAYLISYRPLLFTECLAGASLFRSHYFQGIAPKLIGGVYLSLAAFATFLLLRRWNAPPITAAMVPAFFVCHTAINEITLWNTQHGLGLVILLFVLGFLLWEGDVSKGRLVWGFAAIVAGVLGYQVYLMIAFMLLIVEITYKRLTRLPRTFRETARKTSLVFAAASFYVGYQEIWKRSFLRLADRRGFAEIESYSAYLDVKLHGLFNLLVNAYMPIVSFHFGLQAGWQRWEWIPLLIALATAMVASCARLPLREVVLLTLYSLLLPVVPALATFLINQTPESWRVSLPAVLAACLAMLPLLTLLESSSFWVGRKGFWSGARHVLFASVCAVPLLSMLPASAHEARFRVLSNELDSEILSDIDRYWSTRGYSKRQYQVTVNAKAQLPKIEGDPRERALTFGYDRMLPYSSFGYSWSWRGYLVYNGFEPLKPDLDRQLFDSLTAACREQVGERQRLTGWRVVHSSDPRASMICR